MKKTTTKPKFKTARLQNPEELNDFISLMKKENVTSYLEIGSKFGGSLWTIGWALPRGSTIVSIDLPHGDESFKVTEPALKGCIDRLNEIGQKAYLYLGDSTKDEAIDFARRYGPYDCIFIDANHTEPYVRADWGAYGPMGRMIAFHDIGWVEPPNFPKHKMPIHVPKVWNELKKNYRHVEFKHDKGHNGIGVLWRS